MRHTKRIYLRLLVCMFVFTLTTTMPAVAQKNGWNNVIDELNAGLEMAKSAEERMELREQALETLANAAADDEAAREAFFALRAAIDRDPLARSDATEVIAQRVKNGLVYIPTPGDQAAAAAYRDVREQLAITSEEDQAGNNDTASKQGEQK